VSKIPGPDNILWRFVAGQPLDGHYRTDATYWRRGQKNLHKTEPHRWSYLSGAERTLLRVGALAAAGASVWGWTTHRGVFLAAAAFLALLAAVWGVWVAVRTWREWHTFRHYVKPLDAVLRPLLALPRTVAARDYITVPATFATVEDTPVRIILPRHFNPSSRNREALAEATLPKIGRNEDNTDVVFHAVGNPYMELKMAPQPPLRVPWADVVTLMESLERGQVLIGLGQRDKPFIRNFLEGESPHWGFSCNTGTGKSFFLMSTTAQVMHQDPGTTVTFIDPKGSSLPKSFVGVPGYTLYGNPDNVQEMWGGILAFEAEMDRRRAIKLNDPTVSFPLMFLFLDELSEFADMTQEEWDEIREKGDKKKAPIWRSIARIIRLVREYDGRVVVVTQRLDNPSTGGLGLRDLLGFRGLAGFRRNQWMMLVGTTPVPKASPIIGRWIYSDGFSEWWVQNVFGDPIVMRDYALVGRRDVSLVEGRTASSPGETVGVGTWDIVGLEAAADYAGLSQSAFVQRRKRAEGVRGEGRVGHQPAFMKEDIDAFMKRPVATS
jgi:hypothetical protein